MATLTWLSLAGRGGVQGVTAAMVGTATAVAVHFPTLNLIVEVTVEATAAMEVM